MTADHNDGPREEWPAGHQTRDGECHYCRRRCPVQVWPDPFLAEVHPDSLNPPRAWCRECWLSRRYEV
jgi:hypothetical protein